jgi:hypothetical protein
MGLMTMLTGKPRFQRQLEARHEKLLERSMSTTTRLFELGLGVEKSNFPLVSTSTMIGVEINQYVTHYVRSKLTLHPKWTTEGNFEDEGKLIVSHLLPLLAMLKTCDPSNINWIPMVFTETDDKTEDLILNMFKNCPLYGLMRLYPDETINGLKRLKADLRYLASLSSIDHDIEFIEDVITKLTVLAIAS